MNARIALFFGAAALVGVLSAGLMYYFKPPMAPRAQVSPPVPPTLFVIDPVKIKTVHDVVRVLEAFNIRMGVNLNENSAEVKKFKQSIDYFKVAE